MKKKRAAKKSAAKPSVWKGWIFGWIPVGLLVTLPALIVTAGTNENFRLPKLILSELLVLLTLAGLSLRLRRVEWVSWRDLVRQPVILATIPLVLVVFASVALGSHLHHGQQALTSLLIGAAALVGWSLGMTDQERERVFLCSLFPATLLSVVAILQFHDLAEVFQFQDSLKERISVTSLAGGAFDLSAYLLLPALIAQRGLATRNSRSTQAIYAFLLGLFLYGIAITQTLSVLAALFLSSLVLWFFLLPRRQFFAASGALMAVGLILVLAISPLRQRVDRKLGDLQKADLNQLLTGRLDGWRAAGWMMAQNPILGVGHGAYRAEFGGAKLALKERGARFYRRQHQPYFVNAHNELLEVAAETGGLGFLAVLWGLFWVFKAAKARSVQMLEGDRALLVAGTLGIGVIALTNFPFRIALVAYPMIFFASWIFARPSEAAEAVGKGETAKKAGKTS